MDLEERGFRVDVTFIRTETVETDCTIGEAIGHMIYHERRV